MTHLNEDVIILNEQGFLLNRTKKGASTLECGDGTIRNMTRLDEEERCKATN